MALTTNLIELAELTTAERDALTPNIATVIYNTDIDKLQLWNGAWIDVPSSGGGDDIDSSTGIITGGVLSVGTGGAGVATTFNISDGTGQVVTNAGVKTPVSWSGLTDLSLTYLATNLITFVGINSVGTVVQQTTPFTPTQSRTIIVLGVVVHVNFTNVDTVNNEQHIAYNVMSSVYDALEAISFFNDSGNIFSANGANMNINKSVGIMFKMGSNYDTDINNPHERTLAALNPATFQYRFSDGTSGIINETNIDPNNLDDGAGGLTSISANRWSIQRIYCFTSNNVKIQRGVSEYATQSDAIAGISTEPYVTEPSIAANGLLRGWLIVKQGATVLNGSDALFLSAPKFGEGNAGATGSPINLQEAYENSDSNPEITTNTSGGAVTIRRGSAADTDDIIQGQNGVGTKTFSVKGDGEVLGLNVKKANLNAVTTPLVTDDNTVGYEVGSIWVNTGTDKSYICCDSTTGSAVWVEITAGAGGGGVWQPPSFTLGDGATSGVSVFANTGAGAYWSFDGASDDSWVGNIELSNNGIDYDGSNLALVLRWKISSAPSASDDVEWVVDYAFTKDGDNAQTEVTTNTDNVVVDGETVDLLFSTQLSTMTGEANADVIQLTITRNSTGAGADSYNGDAELLAIKLIKV
jgi:hypothetical protein